MSIELKQEAQRALEALEEIALAGMSGTGQESEEGMRDWHARQAWKFIGIAARALDPLRTAIQQAEAKTDEPVAWLYIEDGEVMFGHPNGYRPPDARPLVFGDTHPAPGVPDDGVRDAERWRAVENASGDLTLRLHNSRCDQRAAIVDAAMLAASPAQKGQP